MGYYPQPYQPVQPKPRRSPVLTCLILLVVLVLLLVIAAVAVLIVVRPQISKVAGATIGGQLRQQIDQQINAKFGEVAQSAPDFSGAVSISDAEINQYIREHPGEISPASEASLRFQSGEIVAEVTAYGVSGTAYTGLTVRAGRVVAVNPRIEGTLSVILDVQEITKALEDALNDQLAQNGKQISAITIEPGFITATVTAK